MVDRRLIILTSPQDSCWRWRSASSDIHYLIDTDGCSPTAFATVDGAVQTDAPFEALDPNASGRTILDTLSLKKLSVTRPEITRYLTSSIQLVLMATRILMSQRGRPLLTPSSSDNPESIAALMRPTGQVCQAPVVNGGGRTSPD